MSEKPQASLATLLFCAVRADQQLYGIDVRSLREISTTMPITPVPPAVSAVRGLANLRSRILLVLDLRAILGLAPAPCTEDSRLIIFKPSVAEDTGLLVDSGGNILAVPEDRIEKVDEVPASQSVADDADATSSPVAGVCKLEK